MRLRVHRHGLIDSGYIDYSIEGSQVSFKGQVKVGKRVFGAFVGHTQNFSGGHDLGPKIESSFYKEKGQKFKIFGGQAKITSFDIKRKIATLFGKKDDVVATLDLNLCQGIIQIDKIKVTAPVGGTRVEFLASK